MGTTQRTRVAWVAMVVGLLVAARASFADEERHFTLPTTEHGSETNQAAIDYARSIGCPKDDAGHIQANRMGGSGTDLGNIFPQNLSVNRGKFRTWEGKIMGLLPDQDRIDVEVKLVLDDPVRPLRPTRIVYCYAATRGSKVIRDCETFENPRPSDCKGSDDPGLEDLLRQAHDFHKDSLALHNTWQDGQRRYLGEVCGKDIERAGDPQSAAADRAYASGPGKTIADDRAELLRKQKELSAKLRAYLKGATEAKAEAATKALAEDLRDADEHGAVIERTLVDEKSRIKLAAIKQHEDLQRLSRCEASDDGTDDRPDCRDDDTCTVFEFGPQGTAERSRLDDLARRNARRATDTLKTSSDSRIKLCFAKNGPTKGAGYRNQLVLYRSCK